MQYAILRHGKIKAPLMGAAVAHNHRTSKLEKCNIDATLTPLNQVLTMDGTVAERLANKLKGLLPHAGFQGKGLWATEGVVTFPFDGRYPLAYLSHFYEFADATDGKVFAPWQLREGQEVIPITRYKVND